MFDIHGEQSVPRSIQHLEGFVQIDFAGILEVQTITIRNHNLSRCSHEPNLGISFIEPNTVVFRRHGVSGVHRLNKDSFLSVANRDALDLRNEKENTVDRALSTLNANTSGQVGSCLHQFCCGASQLQSTRAWVEHRDNVSSFIFDFNTIARIGVEHRAIQIFTREGRHFDVFLFHTSTQGVRTTHVATIARFCSKREGACFQTAQ